MNGNTPLRSTFVPRLPVVLRRSLARGPPARVRRRKVQPEPERTLAQAGGNGLGASADPSIFRPSVRLPRHIAASARSGVSLASLPGTPTSSPAHHALERAMRRASSPAIDVFPDTSLHCFRRRENQGQYLRARRRRTRRYTNTRLRSGKDNHPGLDSQPRSNLTIVYPFKVEIGCRNAQKQPGKALPSPQPSLIGSPSPQPSPSGRG